MTLSKVEVGNTFKTESMEHIVLEHLPDGKTVCMLKDFYKRAKFDNDSNDYKKSSIRKMLNTEFLDKLSAEVGAENIIEHTVDLTSDEGNKKYGSVQDKISLPMSLKGLVLTTMNVGSVNITMVAVCTNHLAVTGKILKLSDPHNLGAM